MNRVAFVGALLLAVAGSVIGWTARSDHAHRTIQPPPTWRNTEAVEDLIPFDVRVSSSPFEECEPLEVDVIVTEPSRGQQECRWRLVDGHDVLMECGSFDELYTRCDGHGCYVIRNVETLREKCRTMKTVNRHVCLK